MRGHAAQGGGYRLEAVSISALRASADLPPSSRLLLTEAPGARPRRVWAGKSPRLVWGQRLFQPGADARRAPVGQGSAKGQFPRSRARRLAWAGRVLQLLGHAPEAEVVADTLRVDHPDAAATRDLIWAAEPSRGSGLPGRPSTVG
ncbi:MAG: hypothetical protein JKY65_06655 [Planctomycetes bacterium]|nr:hypothetical protein [Planctomycetota bacterium]